MAREKLKGVYHVRTWHRFRRGASKATLLDKNGQVVATATAEYPTHYGDGGKAEQNPARRRCVGLEIPLAVVSAEFFASFDGGRYLCRLYFFPCGRGKTDNDSSRFGWKRHGGYRL